jgi:hypothetical protein
VVAFGLLLISVDLFQDEGSRWYGVGLFAALLVVAIVGLVFLPPVTRPGCVAAAAISVPAVFGFMFFPETKSFGDLRPFFLLTIAVWAVLWIAPRTRGRPLFVGLALALFWLWMLGETAGLDAYSASPIPSPPYMTTADFHRASARPAQVTIDDLDPSNTELYPLARQCEQSDYAACDALTSRAPSGSAFHTFGETCGNRIPTPPTTPDSDSSFSLSCELAFGNNFGSQPTPILPITPSPVAPSIAGPRGLSDDKRLEIGLVSLLIAGVYLAGLAVCDRRRYFGLGTAFVVPAVLALVTGVSAFGDWTGELFAGGLVALAAGIVLGFVGQARGRRFTTWSGGLLASIGTLLVAIDVSGTNTSEEPSDHLKLIGPGLLVMLFGALLIGAAWLLGSFARPSEPPTGDDLPVEPPPVQPSDSTPDDPALSTPDDPAAWPPAVEMTSMPAGGDFQN